MNPPIPKKLAKELTLHGDTRIDHYYWMNQREDPEVIAHLQAENAYFEARMAHVKDFQETLFQEIKGRIKEDDSSVPYTKHGYVYQTRYEVGDQYPRYLRTPVNKEQEELLFDVNEMAKPYDYYDIGGMSVSDDNRYISYGEDTLSRRIYTIHIKDTLTGQNLADQIPNTTGGSVWSADGDYLFYSVKDDALRPYKIMRHRLGTAPQDDVVVYEEADETFRAYVYRSKSRKYIIIGSAQTVSTEYRILEATTPLGGTPPVPGPGARPGVRHRPHRRPLLRADQLRGEELPAHGDAGGQHQQRRTGGPSSPTARTSCWKGWRFSATTWSSANAKTG